MDLRNKALDPRGLESPGSIFKTLVAFLVSFSQIVCQSLLITTCCSGLSNNRTRQAIQFIFLLIGLGIVARIGTRTTGLTISLNYSQRLSKDLTESLEEKKTTSLITIQNQLDSLAAVVFQNRREFLIAEKFSKPGFIST